MNTKKLIEKLEKISGKKVKLAEGFKEAPKPVSAKTKLIYGTIAGGRGGTRYSSKIVEMDLSTFDTFRASYEELSEDLNEIEYPNGEEDYKIIYDGLAKKEAVAVIDSYGEGVIGFGFDSKDVKIAVYEAFNNDDDDDGF